MTIAAEKYSMKSRYLDLNTRLCAGLPPAFACTAAFWNNWQRVNVSNRSLQDA
jgi:hypothetical protein